MKTQGCADSIVYPVPSAGSSAFYTTWSFYACMVSMGLLVVYLTMTLVGKGPKHHRFRTNVLGNRVFQLVAIALIAMPALNSVGVLSTSQFLLAKNFKLVNKTKGQKVPDDVAISTMFFHNAMNINLDAHIVPGVLGVCILVCLALGRQKPARSWRWNLGLAGLIILLNLLLAFVWMAVPVEDSDTHQTYQWISKIRYVYADPQASLFIPQFIIVIVLAFIMAFRIA